MDGLRVEFLPEPGASELLPPPERHRRFAPRAVVTAAALLIVGVVVASMSVSPIPRPRPACADGCDVGPSPAIVALFAEHLPGSVVVDEHSVSSAHGTVHVLRLRALRAVYGNVVITMTIGPAATTAPQPQGVHIVHDGYLIDFSFAGYYPPTQPQLQALADDPRLISLRA